MRQANIHEPQRDRLLVTSIKIVEDRTDAFDVITVFLVVRPMREGDMTIFAAGCQRDEVRHQHGAWKFARKTVVLDSRRVDVFAGYSDLIGRGVDPSRE